MAALERFGLANTSMSAEDLRIEIRHSVPEMAMQFAMASVRLQARRSAPHSGPKRGWPRLRHRMRGYVESVDGWFIRYDNDKEIVSAYRESARAYGSDFLEGEALADHACIGDRTFGEWKSACDQALGRILCHIDFATILHYKEPRIAIGNVGTIFARREDVAEVWVEAGLDPVRVRPTMDALTLSIDNLDEWERSYDAPCPFYIDFGRDFVLMPSFGALTNPYVALFRHLRSVYRSDWDRSVDQREETFRQQVAQLFCAPRFRVPASGFKLRRPDGSVLTDVDAVIADTATGSVALMQLKWHDLFGHSLSERESRRKNLLAANTWVGRVHDWIANRSSGQIADELKLACPRSDKPPLIYVITRYAARFSGETEQDERSAWLSWFEIVHMLPSCMSDEPLGELPGRIRDHEVTVRIGEAWNGCFAFRRLRVELAVLP